MVCAECLRPFSVPIGKLEVDKPATEVCIHCGQDFSYFINSMIAATDVMPPSVLFESQQRVQTAKAALREVSKMKDKSQ